MSFLNEGYNKYLSKASKQSTTSQELDPSQLDQFISELSGTKITNYTSINFNFIPTTPSANPKEGDLYYDKTDRKLKIYTGSSYEAVTSV